MINGQNNITPLGFSVSLSPCMAVGICECAIVLICTSATYSFCLIDLLFWRLLQIRPGSPKDPKESFRINNIGVKFSAGQIPFL